MGRTNRVSRQDQATTQRPWFTMEDAPKDGMVVELWIPYTSDTEETCADVGYWDSEIEYRDPRDRSVVLRKGCWRFNGDDGAFDIQPTKWRPLRQYPMGYSLHKFKDVIEDA